MQIDQNYYFISGPNEIHALNEENSSEVSRKMRQEEIDSLPEKIMFDGIPSTFYSDEEKAYELLAIIIRNMNLMQEEKVWTST